MSKFNQVSLIIAILSGLVLLVGGMSLIPSRQAYPVWSVTLNENTMPTELRDRLFFSKVSQSITAKNNKVAVDSAECIKLVADYRLMLTTSPTPDTELEIITKAMTDQNCFK